MKYDAIIIGAGLSGLTAASLLAKRGLKTVVIDKNADPGGSCGVFKRGSATFDQGAAMLYGFGKNGFNPHRFLFNCLGEDIDMIRHDLLYCVDFGGRRIRFMPDVEQFADELSRAFPDERDNIHRFYRDMSSMYRHIMVENPTYASADETPILSALKSVLHHPLTYIRFLRLLNKSAESLLARYFKDPDIFDFFSKLTSTYCYASVKEAPAVLAAVMFIDNHVGGSYYPAGSTAMLTGKLEKVIEENGGEMIYGHKVVSLRYYASQPFGVQLDSGKTLFAPYIIYSGTVWNLFGELLDPAFAPRDRRAWAARQEPTFPSIVLYATVCKSAIPADAVPVEMLACNTSCTDESEVTVYIMSIDDRTLCAEDEHTVVAIGPTFRKWNGLGSEEYAAAKKAEQDRLLAILEKRFPGFSGALRHAELATPRTIERYTMKNGGAVAGPKQKLGQHMLKRLHTRSEWKNLFFCGESTVMGTGTPAVTVSGISAANAVLRRCGKKPFIYESTMTDHVHIVEKPVTVDTLYSGEDDYTRRIMLSAMRCRFCEYPCCSGASPTDIRGMMRRASAGNICGAKKRWLEAPVSLSTLREFEKRCILGKGGGEPVHICDIIASFAEVPE